MHHQSFHQIESLHATSPEYFVGDNGNEFHCVTLTIRHTDYRGEPLETQLKLFSYGPAASLIVQQPPAVEEVAA